MSRLEKGAVAAVSVQSVIYLELPYTFNLHSPIHILFIIQSRAYAATSVTRTTTTIAAASW